MKLDFFLADVFTSAAGGGNQLAVFPWAQGLSVRQMQFIARQFNFSETVFVHPPEKSGNFRLRIFTPGEELPMAGHPTLGAAAVLLDLGLVKDQRIVFVEGIGPVPVEIASSGEISMDQGTPKFGPIFEEPDKWAPVVGLSVQDLLPGGEIQMVSCGLYYLMIPVKDREALQRARVQKDLYQRAKAAMNFGEIYLWCKGDRAGTYHTRMFAPSLGIEEDAATGSAAGPFLCYLVRNGVEELADGRVGISILQGEAMGRPSELLSSVRYEGGKYTDLRVSGKTVIWGRGSLRPESVYTHGEEGQV